MSQLTLSSRIDGGSDLTDAQGHYYVDVGLGQTASFDAGLIGQFIGVGAYSIPNVLAAPKPVYQSLMHWHVGNGKTGVFKGDD